MCELLALVAPRPFSVLETLPLVCDLERWGIAGMGFGAAWIDAASGTLRHYKRDTAVRDDGHVATALGDAMTTTLLVHLRRPSLLSTRSLADTQPFVCDQPAFAFAHNGELKRHDEHRPRYAARNLLHGRADTEVGFQHLVELRRDMSPAAALLRLQEDMDGPNNYLYLDGDGLMLAYSAIANDNPIYRFRRGDQTGAVTALYSRDRAVFDLVLPDAEYLGDLPIGRPEALSLMAAGASAVAG